MRQRSWFRSKYKVCLDINIKLLSVRSCYYTNMLANITSSLNEVRSTPKSVGLGPRASLGGVEEAKIICVPCGLRLNA